MLLLQLKNPLNIKENIIRYGGESTAVVVVAAQHLTFIAPAYVDALFGTCNCLTIAVRNDDQ